MSKRSKNQKARAQARRSQKQRERKTKRALKNKRQTQPKFEINLRHQKRIAAQQPKAWENETLVDDAVFADEVLTTLDQDLQSQVLAVRNALESISKSDGERALDCVSMIPRKSQLSQWRLLIRGLDSWLANDIEAARVAWARLDQDRRPARIANVLSASECVEISAKVEEQGVGQGNPPAIIADLDSTQLSAARLVRRIRIDRAALRVASALVLQPKPAEAPDDAVILPELIQRIREFARDFEQTEPRLINAIRQHALLLSYSQVYVDVFELARNSLTGPAHDPNNFLLGFFYFVTTPGKEQRADLELEKYLNQLPKNDRLPKALRNAMLSQSYLNEANSQINQPMPYFYWDRDVSVDREIESFLKKSTAAYPLNRDAHKAHADWLQSLADNQRTSKQRQKQALKKLSDVMKRWAKAIDDAAEPRLWLVDYLLENEQLDEAEPYVQWLSVSRQDDPRIRATPWKWHILESMRLCRRKNWLPQVPSMLEESSRLWPAWLPKDWMGYLQAAFHLRNGDVSAYEHTRNGICRDLHKELDSPVDACMMLGAAQRMRVPTPDLKPLRIPVDEAVKQVKRMDLNHLFATGSFFWDLHRMGLNYPAQRMHAGKFGKELLARFKASPSLYNQHKNDRRFLDTLFWCAESRFWCDGYELHMPSQFVKLTETEPIFAGAFLNTKLKLRFRSDLAKYDRQLELVAETANNEPDPFYRFWFRELVENVEKALSEDSRRGFSRSFDAFANMFGGFGSDEGECDCPKCVARRAKQSAKTSTAANTFDSATQSEFDFAEL